MVTEVGADTVCARLRELAEGEGKPPTPLERRLDELGRRQAAAVALLVTRSCEVDSVVSSPLKRAMQTAVHFEREVEVDGVRLRPHPHEFELYFDI